jgi:hypothetical protein
MTMPGHHTIRVFRRLYWRAIWLLGAQGLSLWLTADATKGTTELVRQVVRATPHQAADPRNGGPSPNGSCVTPMTTRHAVGHQPSGRFRGPVNPAAKEFQ